MNGRERFLAVCRFERPDRWFLWPEAISDRLWRAWPDEARSLIGGLTSDEMAEVKPMDLGVDTGPLPRYREKVLEEGNGIRLVRTDSGKIRRHVDSRSDLGSVTVISKAEAFPVTDDRDFEKLKERYQVTAKRLPDDWHGRVEQWKRRTIPLLLKIRGFFGCCLGWMGYEQLCEGFHLQPGLIHRMMDHWCDFLVAVLRPVVEAGIVDCVMVAELGLAHATGPSISPAAIREFMIPRYRRLISFLREGGISMIWFRNKGRLIDVLPLFIETGVNGVSNLNRFSGNDPAAIRAQHPGLVMMGGLDKRWLLQGRDAVEAEVGSLVPNLVNAGGYFPCLDGGLLEDIPLETFLAYAEARQRACGL